MNEDSNTDNWFRDVINGFFQWLNRSSLSKVKAVTVVPLACIGFTSIQFRWTTSTGLNYQTGSSMIQESAIMAAVIIIVVLIDFLYFRSKFKLERQKDDHEIRLAILDALQNPSLSKGERKELLSKL